MTEHLDLELVDLVAGHLDADQRVALAEHLRGCPSCLARYNDLAVALGEVTAAVPPVAPPLGFDGRVVVRLLAEAGDLGRSPATARRRTRVTLAAAALLLAVAAGVVVGVLGGRAGDNDRAGTADQATAPLVLRVGVDGDTVGSVSFGRDGDRTVMVVALFDAPTGISYTCRTHLADGTTVESEPWPAVGRGAWVVDLPAEPAAVRRVELVATGTDQVWSSATP